MPKMFLAKKTDIENNGRPKNISSLNLNVTKWKRNNGLLRTNIFEATTILLYPILAYPYLKKANLVHHYLLPASFLLSASLITRNTEKESYKFFWYGKALRYVRSLL